MDFVGCYRCSNCYNYCGYGCGCRACGCNPCRCGCGYRPCGCYGNYYGSCYRQCDRQCDRPCGCCSRGCY